MPRIVGHIGLVGLAQVLMGQLGLGLVLVFSCMLPVNNNDNTRLTAICLGKR